MNEFDFAPVVMFVYNRPWHTRQSLESLMANELADKSILYIYADGPKENATEEQLEKIQEVRRLVREKEWCKEVHIIEQEKNIGLSNSIINGVTEIVNKYEKVVVLEDDLVLSEGFLKYMNEGLSTYENDEKVMLVSGYFFPVKKEMPETFFLLIGTYNIWGWGTWKRSWNDFDNNAKGLMTIIADSKLIEPFNFYGSFDFYEMLTLQSQMKIQSWDICWYASVFLKGGICLHPRTTLVRNIGSDGSGTHCKYSWWSDILHSQKVIKSIRVTKIPLSNNKDALKEVKNFYTYLNSPPLSIRVKEKMIIILKNIFK